MASTTTLALQTKAVAFSASALNQVTIVNGGGGTLYYKGASDVDSGDTAVTSGSTATVTVPTWIVSASSSAVTLVYLDPAPTFTDLTIADDVVITDTLDAGAITGTSVSVDGAAGLVATADGGKNTLDLSSTAANVGITIGGDVEIFRTAANALTITDATTFTGGSTHTGTLAATNAATVGTTLGVTGITTTTGGIGAAATKARALNIKTSDVDVTATLAGFGTDAAAADGTTVYLACVYAPFNCTVTGIATLNGTNITTDKIVNYLFNAAGTMLGKTAAAGTAPTPADVFQEIDLTAPLAITGPAVYFIGRQHNGTTIGFQSIAASKGHQPLAGSVAGTSFGAETTVVPPTTFTADKGPFGYLY